MSQQPRQTSPEPSNTLGNLFAAEDYTSAMLLGVMLPLCLFGGYLLTVSIASYAHSKVNPEGYNLMVQKIEASRLAEIERTRNYTDEITNAIESIDPNVRKVIKSMFEKPIMRQLL